MCEYMQNILNFKGTHYEYVKLSGSPHFLIGDKKKEAAYGYLFSCCCLSER